MTADEPDVPDRPNEPEEPDRWDRPPVPDHEDLRLKVLRGYDILETPPEEAFDDLTALAAHICQAPICMINLVDEDRIWTKSGVGFDQSDMPRVRSFCAHAIGDSEALVVPDASGDAVFRTHPLVQGEPHIRFYAGMPLVSPEGQVVGTLCVVDREPRTLEPNHELALRVLGRHVMALLELRRRSRERARTAELEASIRGLEGEVAEGRSVTAAVQRERDLADAMINSLPGIFYLLNREGRFLRWNRNLERVTGYSTAELSEVSPLDVFEGTDRDRVAQRIDQVFETGSAEVEAELRTRGGRSTPYFLTGRTIEFDGETCLIGMGMDITARRRAEVERDRLFELSPDLFCVAGFDGHFKQLNPAWEETLGYTREELQSRPYVEFVHPDDVPSTEAKAEEAASETVLQTFQNRYHCRDGSWRWLEWNSTPVPEEELIFAVARDVTESREMAQALARSEESFRSLIESARDGIFTVSAEGILTSLNSAFETLTSRSRDDWVGARFEPLVHPEDLPRALEAFEEAVGGGNPPPFELRLLASDETPVPMELTLTAQRKEDRVVSLLGIARDIRERRALEEQLRRIQKLDSIGRLAAGIAHDFNNLLTVQQATVSLLLMEDDLTRDVVEGLEEIAGATDRAAALTRQLLLFSRKQRFEMSPTELNEVVEELAKMLRRVLGENLALELDLDRPMPVVLADTGMIEQVLLNLAVNARDAMAEGGTLTVRSRRVELDRDGPRRNPEARPGRFVCLEVADTGAGISPEVLKHIFEPFFTTKSVGEGTGLGLATAHGIIQQHRGWIEVDSTPGRGTEFRIFIPVADGALGSSDSAKHGADELRGDGETILLVEDESAVARVVEAALERHGYRVLRASDGVEALETWKEEGARVDLLLTDIVMPGGIDGRELAERLRDQRRGLRVIFTSGYRPERSGGGPATPASDTFLQKPYAIRTLLQAVRDRLATAR